MHISEGIVSGEVLAAGWAVSAAGIAIGLKKTDTTRIVRTALLSSAFFLASLVNVRLGPSSTHLSLLAPVGLILGWSSFPAMFTALLLQAILFHFGGLAVLGVNTMNMALPALIVYIVFGKSARKNIVIAFIAGFLAVMIGAGLVGVCLGLTDGNFFTAAKIIILAHIPLAVIEGIVTMFMFIWLKKSAPEFLS